MGEPIEKIERELQESRESQKRLLKQLTELEKQLKDLEFHHRSTNQLLISIIDMDAALGGDRSSLKRRIKILTYIDDHLHSMGPSLSEITLQDIILALITSSQEFGLPPDGIRVTNFFTQSKEETKHHTLDTQTALIAAICIADMFAGLFTISETILLEAHHLKEKDRVRLRCQAGVSSRLAEEILNQISQGAFFSLLQDRLSISFLPPNPQEGPGLDLYITYGF